MFKQSALISLLTLICLGVSGAAFADDAAAKLDNGLLPDVQPAADATSTKIKAPLAKITPWIKVEVKKGDTLVSIFRRHGLDANQWQGILNLGDAADALVRLKPGDQFQLRKTPNGELAALSFPQNAKQTLEIQRTENGLTAQTHTLKTQIKQVRVSGEVQNSLTQSLHDAGAPYKIINQLAGIFEWRRNLSRTVHNGDQFSIVYEAEFYNGKPIHTGSIIAASLEGSSNHTDQAFSFTDQHGNQQYYDARGQSYAPSILRTPVNYQYISSSFNLHRKHPKLGITRPHRGVDLAANYGSPIHAAADGVVTYVGRQHGYGNLVKLKHAKSYATRYAHMSRFKSGLKVGDRVKQNDVIGYVGATGLATGNHLHFEIHKNGIAYDPIHMKLPKSFSLAGQDLVKFTQQIQPMVAKLSGIDSDSNPLILAAIGAHKSTHCHGSFSAMLEGHEHSPLGQLFCEN